MSTWDDKPNDYEHSMQEIERLRAANAALLAALRQIVEGNCGGWAGEIAEAAIKAAEGEWDAGELEGCGKDTERAVKHVDAHTAMLAALKDCLFILELKFSDTQADAKPASVIGMARAAIKLAEGG